MAAPGNARNTALQQIVPTETHTTRMCKSPHYKIHKENEMNGVLSLDAALQRYTGTRTTSWANERDFVMNHGPCAGSIVRPV